MLTSLLHLLNILLSYHLIFSDLINNLANFCPNISSLELDCYAYRDRLDKIKWFSSITGFKNLEKLDISIHFDLVERRWGHEYEPYIEMIQTFVANPMPKMRELKLKTINAFFQDEFLVHLFDIFPNLETFNLVQLGQGEKDYRDRKKKLEYWRFYNLIDALKALG